MSSVPVTNPLLPLDILPDLIDEPELFNKDGDSNQQDQDDATEQNQTPLDASDAARVNMPTAAMKVSEDPVNEEFARNPVFRRRLAEEYYEDRKLEYFC